MVAIDIQKIYYIISVMKNFNARSLLMAPLVLAALLVYTPTAYAITTLPSGFQLNTIVAGLSLPTSFAFAPDGRVFVAQKGGAIREIKNGVLQPTAVVQLTDVNDYADRGVEGIAVDPNFAQNGYIYIAYTFENTPGQNYSGPKTGRIVRLTVVGDTASLSSKVVILGSVGGDAARPSCLNFATTSDCIASDANTHSMGALRFGPDGKLYASLGDGSGYLTIDPEAYRAQDLQWLAGKLVRINTDGTAPSDNPFYTGNANDNQSKVWILGDRNMYRFSFRPSDGKMFIGAVGWATWESVYIGTKGANFGWPCLEGFATTTYNCTPSSTPTYPIYVFDHHTGTGSVMGGTFPTAFGAAYAGNYFFGDYSNDLIKRMVLNSDDTVNNVTDFVTGAGGPVDFQIGPDGTLWYAAINVGQIRSLSLGNAPPPPPPPPAFTCPTPVSGTGTAAPHFTNGSITPTPVVVGHQETITTTISNPGATGPFNYDMEIYDSSVTRVAQMVCQGQSIASGGTQTYTFNWLPPTIGNYTVKVGLFKTDWSSALEWTDKALAVTVLNRAPTGAPPAFAATTTAAQNPTVGGTDAISTSVQNTGGATNALIDIEVYQNGVKVAQQAYDNQFFDTNQVQTYTFNAPVATAGTYKVSVGVFQPAWAALYSWFDQAATFTAGSVSNGGTVPIYQDALAPGWQNWSWGSTEDFSDISQVFAGTKSIKVTYTSAWGGMFLHSDTPINTTGKTSLTFAVAGSGASGQSLQVFMFDSAGTKLAVVNIAPYMTGGITAGSFKMVTIPLADLNAQNKLINGLVIQDGSGAAGASVNIDSIQVQ